jgi:hypothetical protein
VFCTPWTYELDGDGTEPLTRKVCKSIGPAALLRAVIVGNTLFLISNPSCVWLLPHFANLVHSAGMERDHPRDFTCMRCQARYKVVQVKSEPGATHQMLQCTVCQQQLAPTDGDNILKYFLVGRPRAKNHASAAGKLDNRL